MKTNGWLRKFRERHGKSQRAFAREIGVDESNYNHYEMGKLLPGDDFLDNFSDACRLTEAERELLKALRRHDKILRLAIQQDEE